MRQGSILVVEDNPLNARLVGDLLTYNGHAVRLAGDVGDALRRIDEALPDLVLVDVQIPGGGGELLLRRLREDARLVGTPIVAVTAFAMVGDRERLLAEGFDDYVSKPIDTRTFPQRVQAYLRREIPAHAP